MNKYGYTAEFFPALASALKLEIEEGKNCETCTGIADCKNSCVGYCTIVRPYDAAKPKYGPVSALRECRFGMMHRAELKMRHRLDVSGLGSHFWGRTFESFKADGANRAAYMAAKAYALQLDRDNPVKGKHSLLFIGPVGVGKTHLAVAILIESINRNFIPFFIPAQDLMLKYSSSFQANDTREFIEDMGRCELLIIDDLGKEKSNESARVLLFSIVNKRYESSLPTVITTNLSMKDITDLYSDAMSSRLREMCQIIPMGGDDYRSRKQEPADSARAKDGGNT